MADWPYNTQAWQRLRRLKLASAPLCEGCHAMGIVTPANTVDHCVPVNEGGNPFPALSELTSYCPSCHSAKTARGSEAGAVRTRKPRKGCNPDGTPIDPVHPWHAGKQSTGSTRKKSLTARASGPTVGINFELVSDRAGQRPAGE